MSEAIMTDNFGIAEALRKAKEGKSFNNISPIVTYSLNEGPTILWMGDLETDFMENIKDELTMEPADILFAPHHGRGSGKVPQDWLDSINPRLVIIGEAPAEELNYYDDYETITQNTAGNITQECCSGKAHIYVSNPNYSVDFLYNERRNNTYGKYIGTLKV